MQYQKIGGHLLWCLLMSSEEGLKRCAVLNQRFWILTSLKVRCKVLIALEVLCISQRSVNSFLFGINFYNHESERPWM